MSELTPEDTRWLDAAVRYATPFLGTTADNPAVAALIVEPRSQTLIARAVTAKGGRPHAESEAIVAAGFEAAGCTLYVTLEPCHHWGRTPPCVDAIIRAGIMRVVIGAADPHTASGSIARLESAGIETVLARHAPSLALHAGHLMRHATGRPFVTAALAVSADGKIDRSGEGRASIIGSMARDWIAMLRAHSDAILVSAAADSDPEPTVTLPGLATRTPLRVVLAGQAGVGRKLNLIGGFTGHRTAIIAENSVPVDAPISVETIRVAGHDGHPDLAAALAVLGGKGVQNLLLEPDQRLLTAMLDADLIDAFALIATPGTIGEGGVSAYPDGPLTDLLEAAGLLETDRQRLGEDTLLRYARPQQPV